MNRPLVCRLILVTVGLTVYANAFAGPFLFDDNSSILENEHVHSLWPLGGLLASEPETSLTGRPIVAWTFALDWALHGRSVWAYHAVNVALHVLCGLVLFGIVRRTLEGLPPFSRHEEDGSASNRATHTALVVALLWLVHPLNTEAVNYLTQRTELLMGLFYLLTLYAAIRASQAERHRSWWVAGSIAACALGMASKEVMVTAPLMVVLYDYAYRPAASEGERWAWFRSRRPLYAGLASTWIVLALLMTVVPRSESVGTHLQTSAWTYFLNQAVVVARYLRLTVWPAGLLLDYGEPRELTLSQAWMPGFVVLAILGLSLALMIRRPKLGFPALWVFLILAPTSTVVPIATEAGAERRMYLPLMGAVTVLVVGAQLLLVRAARGPRGVASDSRA